MTPVDWTALLVIFLALYGAFTIVIELVDAVLATLGFTPTEVTRHDRR